MAGPTEQDAARARAILDRAVSGLGRDGEAELAIELAGVLLAIARQFETHAERAQANRLALLMDDDEGQAFATALTDRVHRTRSGALLVRQVRSLLSDLGVPVSLSQLDRMQLRALNAFGSSLPELTALAVRQRILHDARPYIVPADPDALAKYLKNMEAEQVRVNVNHLGEEVLGEDEAQRHMLSYLDLLTRPEVNTISVKISSLYSQLDPLAWDHSLRVLGDRLGQIYRQALEHGGPDGSGKLVYLDMESYRDLEMTLALFRTVLERPEFSELMAGIVMQAYLRESLAQQRLLTEWALDRARQGKAPIRLRIVKGANLAMERVIASLRGWPLPTYASKPEVDANYKRLLRYGTEPEHAKAVHLGVASHNLFDLSYALVISRCRGVQRYVELEMLEGMAQPLRRAIQLVADSVLIYAPSVDTRNFPSAVAYLVRRLDENTAEDNFLRHSFGMQPGDERFQQQEQAFLAAVRGPLESQRSVEPASRPTAVAAHFENQPDSDFSRPENRLRIVRVLDAVRTQHFEVKPIVAGKPIATGNLVSGFDPSRPAAQPYDVHYATEADIERALDTARRSRKSWAALPASRRIAALLAVADALRGARERLVSHMVLDAGKRVEEADIEVSEAIDFATYYARQYERLAGEFEVESKGVFVVTPPWNFPLAIPAGGTLAALVAGNSVILKPAPETILVASTLVELCHRAGVPADVLQFVPCEDEAGSLLIRDQRVDAVVLTGATQTAELFLSMRPNLELFAETGGKNAIFVSSMSDHEQACRDVVRSAFGHAGQKCSACSLLLLQTELYQDDSFRQTLLDATRSLEVGSAWELENFVTPLIRPPSGPLKGALESLDGKEQWALEPRTSEDNPRLVSPGIRWHVEPGSRSHTTEYFGPVLSVMCARSLEHAAELIQRTPYGLTAGIQSLDRDEWRRFKDQVDAGNIYVNQRVTGAIVGRQPFGGRKASGFGPGAKAGGPNYVSQFCRVGKRLHALGLPALSRGPRASTASRPEIRVPADPLGPISGLAEDLSAAERERLLARARNYYGVYSVEFEPVHSQAEVLGQHNDFRYQGCRTLLYVAGSAEPVDALSAWLAAGLASASVVTVVEVNESTPSVLAKLARMVEAISLESALDVLKTSRIERARLVGGVAERIAQHARSLGVHVAVDRVHDDGYVELRHYLKEQSVSITFHRYGNLRLGAGHEAAENSAH